LSITSGQSRTKQAWRIFKSGPDIVPQIAALFHCHFWGLRHLERIMEMQPEIAKLAQKLGKSVHQVTAEIDSSCQIIEAAAKAQAAKPKRRRRRQRTSRIGGWMPI
jgi:hypothetical protein